MTNPSTCKHTITEQTTTGRHRCMTCRTPLPTHPHPTSSFLTPNPHPWRPAPHSGSIFPGGFEIRAGRHAVAAPVGPWRG